MKTLHRISLFFIGIIWLASGFVICPKVQAAQTSQDSYQAGVRFEHLMVEDGLPNATVLSVLQDKQGLMWFATADGVGRYDGYSFTTFRHEKDNANSLSNNNTFALIESRDGLIWIGTDPGGLNVYDPETGKFSLYLHDQNKVDSLVNDSIWSLLEASDGSIWVGTRGGLSHLDRKTGKFKNYLVNPENPRALAGAIVYRIYEDRSGVTWVATRNGLQRYDPATDDFTIYKNNPEDPNSITSNNVWAILEDKQGSFWIGTRGGGLNRFDRATGKFKAYRNDLNVPNSLSDNNIWNIYEDSRGNLWITTENGGVNLFDRQAETFTSFKHNPNDPSTLSNNDIYWMTEDRSGVLWLTSRYGGVNKLYPGLWRFSLYRSIAGDPNSLNSNSVYCTLSDAGGTLWIGTFGGGINRYDRKTGTMTVFKNDPKNPNSLSNDKIQDIFKDEKGALWISTSGGGLNRMEPETDKFVAYKYSANSPDVVVGSNFLTKIQSAGEDQLWVGTLGYGLNLFNTITGKLDKEYYNLPKDPNSLTEDTIYDLAVEKSGRVWIATARGGLELLDPKTGIFTHHRNDPGNANSILGDGVYSIYLDETAGMIWAGTASGLSGLDLNTHQWQNYTMRNGLPSDTIMGVQPGSSRDLWVSTGKGISHLELDLKTFTNYDVRDGLQGDQFEIASSSHGPDGELFFGGSNGLTAFRPDQITKNSYPAPIVFTDFQLFNQSLAIGSEILPKPIEKTSQIVLAYEQSVFTIKFAALSYQQSSKNLYQYKMEGFDKDWSPPRVKREATYTNLLPGDYTFIVRAANNDGVWNEATGQTLTIKILPPWWETWWFRVLAVFTAILVILGGIQFRLRNIHAMNAILEKRVVERTQELEGAQMSLNLANGELKNQLEEITTLEKAVRELAIHDALTGLHNRHHLSDRLKSEFSRAMRENYQIAFLLMDIDHFKSVNDTYGHQCGDTVLQQAGKIVSSITRQSDFACRYGGEEFMVVMPKITPQDALACAEHFRKTISEFRTEHEGKKIQITVSIGVAIYPLHGSDQDQILSFADAALYQAKNAGRNQVVMYSPNAKTSEMKT
jgi:diguanylate cyclase (GGDEF)-like protein